MFPARITRHALGLCALLASLLSTQVFAESRCTDRPKGFLLPAKVSCSYKSLWLPSGLVGSRKVIYQTPVGTPPAGGWPVVLIYQGSFFPLDDFTYYSNMPFGGYYEGKLVQKLLDNGYAVVAPSAPGDLFWHTNIPGMSNNYEMTTDFDFLTNVLLAIRLGYFGPLNSQRQYATGISSGGYNSSRMAVSFPGKFKALAVQAGSYATCSGPICSVPSTLPADHPPTLFLHGFVDLTVPWWSMDMYYDRLLQQGIKTKRYTDTWGGHEWFAASPSNILAWFKEHP